MNNTRFAPIFSDHMVLQREKAIRIWGTCRENTSLQVFLVSENSNSEDSIQTSSIAEFRQSNTDATQFRGELPPLPASGPYRLQLFENNVLCQELTDVMIGEVWLAGGQSNMEFELQNDADAFAYFHEGIQPEAVLPQGNLKGSVAGETSVSGNDTADSLSQCNPYKANVRFYQVPRQAFFHEDYDRIEMETHWTTTDDASLGSWSAVAYYYARELSEKLVCCVGIIGCNWGGTSASAWQDKDSLLSHPDTAIYWQEYEAIVASRSNEDYEKERLAYLEYQENWQPKINEFYATHPTGTWEEALDYAGPCKWPGPMGPKHEFRPCGLYETMLKRVIPYSMQGFLYYQGESDDHHPESYNALLKSMIHVWRRDFQDESLFFLNVQLPMHRYANDPISDSWAIIREAQMDVHLQDDRSGLAVIIDQGEYDNIHPTHKKEVGHRLCLQALYHTYHLLDKKYAYGPIVKKAIFDSTDQCILLSFDYCENGLDSQRYIEVENAVHNSTSTAYYGLELCDATGKCISIRGEFANGASTIRIPLSGDTFLPVSVRYLWNNYSLVSLFDTKGMPVAPFMVNIEYPS